MPKKKLWFKLLMIYLLALVIPLAALTAFTMFLLNKQTYQNASQLIQNNLSIVSTNVDSLLRNAEYSLGPVFSDGELKNDLKKLVPFDERATDADHAHTQRIIDDLYRYASYNIRVLSMDLYTFPGETFFSTGLSITKGSIHNSYDLERSPWYQTFLTAPDQAWMALYFIYEDEPQLIRYFPLVTGRSSDTTQVVSVSVSLRNVMDTIGENSFSTNSTLFLTDANGNLFLGSGIQSYEDFLHSRDQVGTNLAGATTLELNGVEYCIFQHRSSFSLLNYTYIVPAWEVNNVNSISRAYTLVVVVFVLAVLLISIFGIFHYIVSPVTHLFSAMDRVGQGELSVRLPVTRQDEIGMVSKNFNSMAADLEKLVEENYRINLFKKELELKFIISQINEHFLYNTLDAIHWSARKYNNQEISTVVSRLSRFYRNVLSNGRDVITVRQVAEIMESYLYVQKFRMQERLNYTVEIDPDTQSFKVLKYLFQPLVENAVLHGVAKRAEGGAVTVRLMVAENNLRFSVSDNGVGIPHDQLTQLLIEIYLSDSEIEGNFALKNINAQLRLYYGESHFLHIESIENIGTTVWFEVPIVRD